jgi:hypothetical protein
MANEIEATIEQKFHLELMSFAAPLWWEINRNAVLGNGTMCLLQTPVALFGVTNDHVLRIYEQHKRENRDVFCQLGSGPFDPTENLIARNRHWDLATFNIPQLTLENWGRKVIVAPEWPPAPLKQGQPIALGGYPENRRTQPEGAHPPLLNTDFVSFRTRADNWSDEHMSFCLDSSTWTWPNSEALPPEPDLSGMSGGPCFRLIPEDNRIELAGIIYEAHQGFEVVRVRQASLILSDGHIVPSSL